MGSQCQGQRKFLTMQLNSRPVRRIKFIRKFVLDLVAAAEERITGSEIDLYPLKEKKPLTDDTHLARSASINSKVESVGFVGADSALDGVGLLHHRHTDSSVILKTEKSSHYLS